MLKLTRNALLAAAATVTLTAAAAAQELIISASLPQSHMWVGKHMDPFADAMEAESNGAITFTRFYAGELSGIGRDLDALQSGTVAVAALLLAPYHEGAFPLSDITQLPVYGTDSPKVTRAFQNLLDSDVAIKDGKTFYQYEIEPKNIRAWALGTTAAYSISSAKTKLEKPADFSGLPLRAGSAIHTIAAQELGATPVTIPGTAIFEAMSRGTVDGIVIAISDWLSYSIEQLIKFTITDASMGHWGSYIAISNTAWDQLSDEQKTLFDTVARRVGLENAQAWEDGVEVSMTKNKDEHGGTFTPVTELSQEMQDHIAQAGANTWKTWIEKTEGLGHPAKATAKLWAELVQAEGGRLPAGVAEYLAQ
jgi:TRAP-type C4-dicarboxylate transport system substrate-binding protein